LRRIGGVLLASVVTGGVNQLSGPVLGKAHRGEHAQSKPKFGNGFHGSNFFLPFKISWSIQLAQY
jgi:hypothetical protein